MFAPFVVVAMDGVDGVRSVDDDEEEEDATAEEEVAPSDVFKDLLGETVLAG